MQFRGENLQFGGEKGERKKKRLIREGKRFRIEWNRCMERIRCRQEGKGAEGRKGKGGGGRGKCAGRKGTGAGKIEGLGAYSAISRIDLSQVLFGLGVQLGLVSVEADVGDLDHVLQLPGLLLHLVSRSFRRFRRFRSKSCTFAARKRAAAAMWFLWNFVKLWNM